MNTKEIGLTQKNGHFKLDYKKDGVKKKMKKKIQKNQMDYQKHKKKN